MAYTLEQLKKTADSLSSSELDGVRGVIKLTADRPGQVLGITVCTHGDEPAGLAAARHVLELAKDGKLQRGTVYITFNNIEASKRYFASKSDDERRKARFIDSNLNRLPDNPESDTQGGYEISRARELLPVWRKFEIGIDFHSTAQDESSMIVSLGDTIHPELISGVPIDRIISNIDRVQTGHPVAHFFGGENAKKMGLECGEHENQRTFDRAVTAIRAILHNLGMVSGEAASEHHAYELYEVEKSVFFPNQSYALTKLFKNFELIPKGSVIASGDKEDIVAEHDVHAIFAARKKPLFLQDEVLFLTKPVKRMIL